jgi:tetratricopeptide (TPR) repeat protein
MFRSDNKNVIELTDKAQKFFQAGNFAGALDYINRAISMMPRNIDLHDFKSDILFHSEEYQEAIKEIEFTGTLEPNNATEYSLESMCYLELGENEKAIKFADKAIKADPDYAFGYYTRAKGLDRLGRTDDAISEYKKALEKDPSDPDVHRELGDLYLSAEKYKMAERELKLALRFRKNDKITNELMVDLKGATEKSSGFITALLDAFKNTGDIDYLIRITDFLVESGDMANAEKIANNFYNSALDNIDLASNLAKVYYLDGKYGEGNEVFKKHIERNDNEETNEEYVKMLVSTSQYDIAIPVIEENIKRYPGEESFIFYKFYALSEKGDHTDALQAIKTLYDNQPESTQYAINYAIELSHNGIKDEPVKILEKVSKISKDPEIERAYYTVYSNEGLYDKAIEYLSRAIEMEDDIEEISDILNPAIEDSISKNYYDKMVQLLGTLSNKEDSTRSIFYTIEKACIMSVTGDKDKSMAILESIASEEDICEIIDQYIDFENKEITEFFKSYYDKHCNN